MCRVWLCCWGSLRRSRPPGGEGERVRMDVHAREVVLDRFAWVDGHADVRAVFRDADALRAWWQRWSSRFAVTGSPRCAGLNRPGFGRDSLLGSGDQAGQVT